MNRQVELIVSLLVFLGIMSLIFNLLGYGWLFSLGVFAAAFLIFVEEYYAKI